MKVETSGSLCVIAVVQLQSFLEKRFLELLELVVVCVVVGRFRFFRPQRFRQVLGANIGRHTKCNSSFDSIFEFADVPGQLYETRR